MCHNLQANNSLYLQYISREVGKLEEKSLHTQMAFHFADARIKWCPEKMFWMHSLTWTEFAGTVPTFYLNFEISLVKLYNYER